MTSQTHSERELQGKQGKVIPHTVGQAILNMRTGPGEENGAIQISAFK